MEHFNIKINVKINIFETSIPTELKFCILSIYNVSSSSECSAQGQIFLCKLKHQGWSSAQRQVFHCKLSNQVAVLLGMNRCGSFPLLSTPHSLLSILTDLKRSEKIPGAPARRWGEWIWLTGPSGLHRNSPQGLNISSIWIFDQIRDPETPITLRPYMIHIERKFVLFLSRDFNIRSPVLRTGVLPLNHW